MFSNTITMVFETLQIKMIICTTDQNILLLNISFEKTKHNLQYDEYKTVIKKFG